MFLFGTLPQSKRLEEIAYLSVLGTLVLLVGILCNLFLDTTYIGTVKIYLKKKKLNDIQTY